MTRSAVWIVTIVVDHHADVERNTNRKRVIVLQHGVGGLPCELLPLMTQLRKTLLIDGGVQLTDDHDADVDFKSSMSSEKENNDEMANTQVRIFRFHDRNCNERS